MRTVDELRPPTAQRLLELWRESGRTAEEPMERALLCNAGILAESCFYRGQAVFAGGAEVLESLTSREMESLLERLTAGGEPPAGGAENPAFDRQRFRRLCREG